MTFCETYEGLKALADLLIDWNDRLPGSTRVELFPMNMHTDECMLNAGEDPPRLFLETIASELADAMEALVFVHVLRKVFGKSE